MYNIKKAARIFAILGVSLALMVSPNSLYHTSADAESRLLSLYADELRFEVNGISYPLSDEILLYNSNVFIPIDDILPKCGYTLGWDGELCATVAVKGDTKAYIIMNSPVILVGDQRCEFELPTMIYHDRAYISIAMFSYFTQFYVTVEGELKETDFNKRDLMDSTFVPDDSRLTLESIAYAKGVTMAGDFAFERVGISKENAVAYANVVNTVASSLPNVSTYNIVVPTSAEFYAPLEMAPYQRDGIKTVYENLSANVMPINAVKPLSDHRTEKIYFSTDHHWTQRGAYYVYNAFAANKGMSIAPLSEFKQVNYDAYAGSFAAFAKGTPVGDAISAKPELLERFIPNKKVEASAYRDMYMKNRIGSIVPVSDEVDSYACFIGGDNPLTVMVSDANTGKKLVIIKESFGNAFATWALENYSEVYVVDPRKFNGFGGSTEKFNLIDFYNFTGFDDLVIINYPVSVSSDGIRASILKMVN